MRNLDDDLSGAWTGWSVQFGIRIGESLHLVIRGAHISGVGSDRDGDFEVLGSHHAKSNRVVLTRRYTYTTEPSQAGVGVPYDYEGLWDGTLVSGNWRPRWNPGSDGGPFEMWPDNGHEELSLERLMEAVESV